jgi:hypothetical protein
MIVGISKYGTGGGKGPVQYLTSERNPDGTVRTPPPVVLRGDPALVRQLIDSLPFKHKYTSGVLSFAPGERITEAMEQRIMDDFERVAFAGLEKDQYSILWVRHTHAGHHELSFVVPRVELSTGKSLNIAPPGKATRALFDTFRSRWNAEYGLADPDDPARSQAVSLPNHIAKLLAAARRDGERPALKGATALRHQIIEAVTMYVRQEVKAGRVKNRDDVEAFLKQEGYAISRAGEGYLSIVEPETGEKIRLKGGLYSQAHFDLRPSDAARTIYNRPDPARAAALAATLEGLAAACAKYHRERYGPRDLDEPLSQDRNGPVPPGQGHGVEPLAQYLERQLGQEAILPARHDDDDPPAPSTRRRQRRQRMQRAIEAIGKGLDDVPGTRAFEKLGAIGSTLSGARARTGAELARLARAGDDLGAAGERLAATSERLRATGTSFAASLFPWLEEKWWERFYGDADLER